MTVAVKLALAEIARAAKDVQWNEHRVAQLQVAHRRADVDDLPDQFVAEGKAQTRVGHEVVMQIGGRSRSAGTQDLDDGVARVLDDRIGLLSS